MFHLTDFIKGFHLSSISPLHKYKLGGTIVCIVWIYLENYSHIDESVCLKMIKNVQVYFNVAINDNMVIAVPV